MANLQDVYITAAGVFFPNDPIKNDEVENYLGLVAGKASRFRKMIQRANGIKNRYYARDLNGKQTHLNEELAANAITDALQNRGISVNDIEMLAAATTWPDTLVPGFASMVHGRIGGGIMDIVSPGGVCAASMQAFKAATNAIKVGDHNNAMVVASELTSRLLKSERFEKESELQHDRTGVADSYQYFNADFLRWMLSDGAGALLLENRPHPDKISLKVDWVELRSYAHEFPACMYMGISQTHDLKPEDSFHHYDTFSDADDAGLFVLRQNTSLLEEGLIASVIAMGRDLVSEGKIIAEQVKWFLPHISSKFLGDKLHPLAVAVGMSWPKEEWFTNLATKGNTGAASIFIILEELMHSNKLKAGDKIITMVPESGRFSVSYAQFTAIAPQAVTN